MQFSAPTDGFKLAYDRKGDGKLVLLLHGWPGDRTDYGALASLIESRADVVIPDLRGFGASDKHKADAQQIYSEQGQARAAIALMPVQIILLMSNGWIISRPFILSQAHSQPPWNGIDPQVIQ
jgi:pimeloyl-ACP methyl ester carboxylesterase